MTLSSYDGPPARLPDISTPALLLDRGRMERNIARMHAKVNGSGAVLRPHLKTAKSVQVARATLVSERGPATVSTLLEAEVYGRSGVDDILYAVGVTPHKLDRVLELRRSGIRLSVIVDNASAARAIAEKSRAAESPIPVLIEIDTDGHRAGIRFSDSQGLLDIARSLHEGGAELRGVLTHAGESYNCRSLEAIEAIAEAERAGAVAAAKVLRQAGLPCPVVSIGSTPTALLARSFEGVTEVRAGVFMFFDLVMAGLGVCTPDDIALSVLTEVIGHQSDKGWILVDAGWMALSRDRGTSKQPVDQGYGLVCDVDGRIYPDLVVVDANQEQGMVALRTGSMQTLPNLPVGTRLRILPNHACATGAQHDMYHVIRGGQRQTEGVWKRFRGW